MFAVLGIFRQYELKKEREEESLLLSSTDFSLLWW
jgi:hypothetical protein